MITAFLKSTGLQVADLSSNVDRIENEFSEQFSADTHWIYTESLDEPNRWTYDGTTLTERSDWDEIVAQRVLDEAAELVVKLAEQARTDRDSLLAATDWTANSDVTMTTEMTAYRQALRDVPTQAGWPTTVNWPTAP